MARIKISGKELVKKLIDDERDFTGIVLEENFDLSGHEAFPELQEHFARRKNHYTGDIGSNYSGKRLESYWASPITFDAAIIMGLKARGLKLPVLRAEGAKFDGSDFSGADLRGSYLQHARLYDVNLEGANFGTLESNTNHGYRGTDLRFALFLRTNAKRANFEGANFQLAEMVCSDFREATFFCSDWNYANAQQSDFRGANLSDTSIFNTNLRDSDLRGVKGLESMTKETSHIPFALLLHTVVDQAGNDILAPYLTRDAIKGETPYLIVK